MINFEIQQYEWDPGTKNWVRRQWMSSHQLLCSEVRWESRKEQGDERLSDPRGQKKTRKPRKFKKGVPFSWGRTLKMGMKFSTPGHAFLFPALSRIQVTFYMGSSAPVLYLQSKLLCWNPFISLGMLISLIDVPKLACDLRCPLIQPTWTQFDYQSEGNFSAAQGHFSAVKEANAA